MVGIVSRFKLHVHQVNGAKRGSQKENFHGRIIKRNKIGE